MAGAQDVVHALAHAGRTVATEASGTMPPLTDRTCKRPTSAMSSRADGSACAVTRSVRPNRLKSLM